MNASLADTIAPDLPYLRRFARTLTGSQDRGDNYVVALLEALVADARQFDMTLPPRTALYRSFINVWDSLPTNRQAEPVDSAARIAADRRIETITPKPRLAFLLASVEEFNNSEIGKILDCDEHHVASLISDAGREIASQIAGNVLIIEDEPLIAMEIETIVTDVGHKVVGIARTRKEAVAMAAKTNPNLVLADVQLADGSSGIDAVADILKEVNLPVIFITAYPERLLTGERPEPAFLIPKPFREEMVKAVISQAMFFEVNARN